MSSTRTSRTTALLTTLLGRAPSAGEIASGLTDALLQAQVLEMLNVGSNSLIIGPTDDIAAALTDLGTDGGGYLNLLPGIYVLTSDLTVPSNVQMLGSGLASTILYMGSYQMKTVSSGVYTTGTVTAASGVNITGSGTAWLANASAGQHIFIGTRWYQIAAVTSNTTLILLEAYGDTVTLPSTYRIATITTDVIFKNFGVASSSTTAIALSDTRRINLGNIQSVLNSVGLSITNCSEVGADSVVVAASVGNGIELTNVGLCDWRSVNSEGNGGLGWSFTNVKKMVLSPGDASGNTGNGMSFADSTEIDLLASASANGGKGIELVSGNRNINIFNGGISGNASDGVKITATSDECKVHTGNIQGNGGYGVNIAASSCDNTILLGNIFAFNGSGANNDSGTGTLIRSNIGLADN